MNGYNIRDQENNLTYYEYDQDGNRTKVRNPRTFETSSTYNVSNLLETVTDAYSKTTVTGYDPADRVTSVKDRWDKTSTFEYDLAGNRVKAISPDSTFTQFGYDENGNRTGITNANAHTSNILYDEVDRLWKTIDALGNTTENFYDEVGQMIKVKDANGKETEYTFNDLDRLTQIKDPLNGTVQFAYDLNGNRVSITDPNIHTTAFEYDALNRVVSETDAVGKGFRYEYDAVGNRSKRTDSRNNITTYDYFLNHKLKTIHYPDSSSVAFTYDANGNRTQMTDANGNTTWTYDNLDRVTQVTDSFSNAVGYAYDIPSDVRKRIVYPGTKNVDYSFDANGRLASLTDWASHTFTYHYDAAGNVAELDYPSGCKEKRSYYTNERLKTLAHEKPDTTQFIAYTYYYDNNGNITGMDRKEAVSREFQAELTNYTYNSGNEIQTAGDGTFSFDASGNQASQTTPVGTKRYVFDFENRLTQITPPTGTTSQFTYNGLGDRIASNEGTAKRHLLDPNKGLTDVLADLDASNAPQQHYLYGLGLVGRVTPGGALFEYHPDHIGSIMAVTDQSNAISAAFAYDEFGAVAGQTGAEAGPWRFCGAIGLEETGNGAHFVRARYYDKMAARFLAHDPVQLLGSTQQCHLYAYAVNNPLRMIDPSGNTLRETTVSTMGQNQALIASTYPSSQMSSLISSNAGSTPALANSSTDLFWDSVDAAEWTLRTVCGPGGSGVGKLAQGAMAIGTEQVLVRTAPAYAGEAGAGIAAYCGGVTIGLFIADTIYDNNQPTNLRPYLAGALNAGLDAWDKSAAGSGNQTTPAFLGNSSANAIR